MNDAKEFDFNLSLRARGAGRARLVLTIKWRPPLERLLFDLDGRLKERERKREINIYWLERLARTSNIEFFMSCCESSVSFMQIHVLTLFFRSPALVDLPQYPDSCFIQTCCLQHSRSHQQKRYTINHFARRGGYRTRARFTTERNVTF